LKQDKRQKNNGKVGASSIGYNLTNQAFGPKANAATGQEWLKLQFEAASLKASANTDYVIYVGS